MQKHNMQNHQIHILCPTPHGMPIDSLGEFVAELEKQGELKRTKAPVDEDLEIAEILRRVTYGGGPAVLFENVKGHKMPVLGNAFGSMKRMEIALGAADHTQIGRRIADMTKLKIPSGLLGKIKSIPELSKMAAAFPKEPSSRGPVTETMPDDMTFDQIPITKSWPHDAGRFITLGMLATRHPDTGVRNLGVYRMQIIDGRHCIVHWQTHKRGARHGDIARDRGEKIPAAIIIGGEPATIFAAVAPVPEGMDKYLFAGIARGGEGISTVRCRTIDMDVPANAEIILEGYVNPADQRDEGPFGDHTGYYTPVERYPVFEITGCMMRKNPTYITTVVGRPILEDAYMGKVIEQSFLPLIQMFHPEVTDFAMPPAGWFQGLAIASIKKRYPGQAKKVMMGLWGMGQLSLTKTIIIVDDDIDVHDMNQVIWAVTTRADAAHDTTIIRDAPTDTLDPASRITNLGSKMGIDATQKTAEEGYMREVQKPVAVDDATREMVDSRWDEYGIQ